MYIYTHCISLYIVEVCMCIEISTHVKCSFICFGICSQFHTTHFLYSVFPALEPIDTCGSELRYETAWHILETRRSPQKIHLPRCGRISVSIFLEVAVSVYAYITLHLHYVNLHYVKWHCINLHYVTVHYITLLYVTLHRITLIIYIALRYTTLHHLAKLL